MARLTIVFGLALVALGVAFWVITGMDHFTPLIPSIFGTLITLCGVVVLIKPTLRKHVMHVSVLIALLGMAGAGMRIPKALESDGITGTKTIEMMLMLIICAIYLVLGIKSFVDARRNRVAGDQTPE